MKAVDGDQIPSDRAAELEAENKRLREALERIAYAKWEGGVVGFQDIARNALEEASP